VASRVRPARNRLVLASVCYMIAWDVGPSRVKCGTKSQSDA